MSAPRRRPIGYGFVFIQTVHGGPWHIAEERLVKQTGKWRTLCGLRHSPMVHKMKRTLVDGICAECEKEIRSTDSIAELSSGADYNPHSYARRTR